MERVTASMQGGKKEGCHFEAKVLVVGYRNKSNYSQMYNWTLDMECFTCIRHKPAYYLPWGMIITDSVCRQGTVEELGTSTWSSNECNVHS